MGQGCIVEAVAPKRVGQVREPADGGRYERLQTTGTRLIQQHSTSSIHPFLAVLADECAGDRTGGAGARLEHRAGSVDSHRSPDH